MSIETLTANILNQMEGVNKWQKDFLTSFFPTIMACRGRINYTSLSRYCDYNEITFRHNFAKPFDFLHFNRLLVQQCCSQDVVLALDPSFISKSGKHTPGISYFWSGCAGKSVRGLEICGIGAVDLQNNTCLHLSAKQTIKEDAEQGLLAYYKDQLIAQKPDLQDVSTIVAVDAYFSKFTFVDPVCEAGYHVVSRLRDDARLRYLYNGPQRQGRGAPRKYAGYVDVRNPDLAHFTLFHKDKESIGFEGIVNVEAMKRSVKLVIRHLLDKQGNVKSVKLYFSTDLTMNGKRIVRIYTGRFQIEFLYRDAKQFAGLEQGQSRKKEAMYFHFNAALTTVSLAKAAHYLLAESRPKSFSMGSWKAQYFNELYLDRIFSTFGEIPKPAKNTTSYLYLRDFGKIAA